MALVRDLGMTLPAMPETIFVTCAAILTTAGSTTPALNQTATGDALVAPTAGTPTTGFGRTIDRIGDPLGTLYSVAMPVVLLNSTRGSTEANRQITLGVRLQHGDSSGGGDMADYSTQSTPASRTYFGTGRTTDMANWDGGRSTGGLNAASNPAYYDLRAAKRYIRAVVNVGKNKVTTESSGDEQARVSAAITFLAAAQIPQVADPKTSPYSTSTSTS